MIENHFTANDYRLNFASTPGEGKLPLLMLHGVTRRWQTFLPLIPHLSLRWQVHALDFRGHGHSDRRPGEYRVADYVADAVAWIDAHTDTRVIIYGHSLGSMVAAAAAAERPGRVAAVVMEDPPLHTMGNRIRETPLHSFFSALTNFAGSDKPANEIAAGLADIRMHNPQDGSEVRLGNARDAASLRFTSACLRRLDPAVLEPIVAGKWLDDFDTDNIFQNINCPALLIQADPNSGGMLIDEDAAQIAATVHDLTHVKLPGCAHLVHWSRTAELLSYVQAFLESLDV